MNQLCFVIMPYGKKKDNDGREVDFDKIYKSLIQPARIVGERESESLAQADRVRDRAGGRA
jgi:hypothetical protein